MKLLQEINPLRLPASFDKAVGSSGTPVAVVFTGWDEREAAAIRAYMDGSVKKVFISGHDSEYAKDPEGFLAKHNIPKKFPLENIVVSEQKSHNTVFEAIAAAKWLKDNNYTNIVIVTSEVHLRRAAMLLRRKLGLVHRLKSDMAAITVHRELDNDLIAGEKLRIAATLLRFEGLSSSRISRGDQPVYSAIMGLLKPDRTV